VGVGFHWQENTSLLPFVCRLQDVGPSPPGFVPYWSSRLKETVAVSNIVLVHTVTLTTWHHPLPPPHRPLCSLSAVRVFKVDRFITRARDETKQNVRYMEWIKQQPSQCVSDTFVGRRGQKYFSLLRHFRGIRARYVSNWGFVLHKNYPVLKNKLKYKALKFSQHRIKTSGNLNTFIPSVVLRIKLENNFLLLQKF
jgi:hypothetical protein